MQPALYVALSAQVALANRLETVASNVANMNTAGYRADEIKFHEIVSRTGPDPVAFASEGSRYTSRQSGPVIETGNPLDIAVEGDAWIGVDIGDSIAYTKDGRMQIDAQGVLRDLAGNAVLSTGGAPIVLDPEAGDPQIAPDGTVTQGDLLVGNIAVFSIDPAARLERSVGSAVVTDLPGQPILEFTDVALRQGYVEGANVNPVREMTKLIMITRAFESASNLIETSERSQATAIRELGEVS